VLAHYSRAAKQKQKVSKEGQVFERRQEDYVRCKGGNQNRFFNGWSVCSIHRAKSQLASIDAKIKTRLNGLLVA